MRCAQPLAVAMTSSQHAYDTPPAPRQITLESLRIAGRRASQRHIIDDSCTRLRVVSQFRQDTTDAQRIRAHAKGPQPAIRARRTAKLNKSDPRR